MRVRAPNKMLYRAYLLKEQLRQVFRVNGRRDAGRTGCSPPTGPDCCATCGFHTPTQGHRDGCAASA